MTQTFEAYQAIKAVNWSTLKHLADSPLHYQHNLDHPKAPTPAMAFGTAAHVATLQPHLFGDLYIVKPEDIDRRTKAGKEEYAAFLEEADGREILKREDYDRCLSISNQVRSDRIIGPYLEEGEAERALVWTDVGTGLRCKGRVDWVNHGQRCILDLKTTGTVEFRRFSAVAAKLGYHGQAAFYGDGYAAMHRKAYRTGLIVVEAKAPHDLGLFWVDGAEYELGQAEYRELLELLQRCRVEKHWPGRYNDEQALRLPRWKWGEAGEPDDIEILEEEVAR
jgi:hypothetical protein